LSVTWIHRLAWLPFLGLLWLAAVPIRRDFASEVASLLLLAASACVLLRTSRAWCEATCLQDSGWPSLRTLAWLSPAAVAVQVLLGTAYRHHLAGVMAHVVWAFAAAILLLMTATFVLTHPQAQGALRSLAVLIALLSGIQLLLGVGAYLARIAAADGAPPLPWLSAVHAATGGLILSLATSLGLLLRHAQPQPEESAA
jgi:hypothetical protein